ncbi:hypothetical protein [Bacillus paranthracis]|uniref:hypothetical protein n=1 Tax=Bacillus paranthracis TaxID=2026186 RepID=UPI001879F827|nr:hypothetical protein [Bacillus paranthracis]
MGCINVLREDIVSINRIEDTNVREIGDIIEYLGDKLIVYYITNEIVKAVKMTDRRNV